MPLLSYFLVVGSVLAGLLFYAGDLVVPNPLPFSSSPQVGLPQPYRAPKALVEFSKPEIKTATVEPHIEVEGPIKAARSKPKRVVRQVAPQDRYAAYPPRLFGRVW